MTDHYILELERKVTSVDPMLTTNSLAVNSINITHSLTYKILASATLFIIAAIKKPALSFRTLDCLEMYDIIDSDSDTHLKVLDEDQLPKKWRVCSIHVLPLRDILMVWVI